jgi:hypothetical protein
LQRFLAAHGGFHRIVVAGELRFNDAQHGWIVVDCQNDGRGVCFGTWSP